VERFGRNGNKSLAFCSGWNLKKGAMASSAAPDDNNIVVMGTNSADMALAVNHLIENKGGQVVVADGKILDFLSLPVGGIVCDMEPDALAAREKEMTKAARELGCELPDPLMYMFFLPITAIPDYAITDVGPVDCIALDTFDPVLELIL
jgi:adenine deaminase